MNGKMAGWIWENYIGLKLLFEKGKGEYCNKIRHPMKKHLGYKDEKSDKFWSVEVQDNTMTVVFGRTGTAGNTSTKEFANAAAALKEAEKQVNEKIKKGYRESPEANAGQFGEIEFWSLIERAKNKSEDVYEQVEVLSELLSQRSKDDILAFEKVFRNLFAVSYRSDLWAAAYIINGGCSDDGFDYFRGWLIAQGKDAFYNALKDPEYLVRIISQDEAGEVECEEMLSVAAKAFILKTGRGYETFLDQLPATPYPELQIDWQEDTVDQKYPKLAKKFGSS